MGTLIAFTAPDPSQEYAFSVADVATGNSYSPKAAGFAPNPPDELIPMVRDGSRNRQAQRYGFLPSGLVPPAAGQYLVYVHPAAGGPPVAVPTMLAVTHGAAPGSNLAVSF